MEQGYTVDANLFNKPKENTGLILRYETLCKIHYDYADPFKLALHGNEWLQIEKIVRIIPGKRLVAYGFWRNKAVVAKLFLHPKKAAFYAKREALGMQALIKAKIPTAQLYYEGYNDEGNISVLLFERLFDAITVEAHWQEKKHIKNCLPMIRNLCIELATQHVLGIVHLDLHLKNFLCKGKKIYTIDGADIDTHPYLLPKKESLKNLALLIAQFGMLTNKEVNTLFHFYQKARGLPINTKDLTDFKKFLVKASKKRWRSFKKKLFRSSSQFLLEKNSRYFLLYDRTRVKAELLKALANPAALFTQPQVTFLKKGNSATIIKVLLDGQWVVIKRYNLKNKWHFLKRCLRTSRAFNSFRLAQKLRLFNIETAPPIAVREEKWHRLRTVSYYFSAYVSDMHAGMYFNLHHADTEKTTRMTKAIAKLFTRVKTLKLTHGDLKITNILVNPQDNPVLIDLDGAKEHWLLGQLKRTWKKEYRRFLKNFHEMPSILERFKQLFDI